MVKYQLYIYNAILSGMYIKYVYFRPWNMIEYSIISKNEQNILYKIYTEEKFNNMENPEGSVLYL